MKRLRTVWRWLVLKWPFMRKSRHLALYLESLNKRWDSYEKFQARLEEVERKFACHGGNLSIQGTDKCSSHK